LGAHRPTADHDQASDANVLVDGRQATDDGSVTDLDMSPERHAVGQLTSRAHDTVMGNVRPNHHQVSVAQSGDARPRRRAAVRRRELPEDVVAPDDQTGLGAIVVAILWRRTEHRVVTNLGSLSYGRRAGHNGM
jgi:hypothetical protein